MTKDQIADMQGRIVAHEVFLIATIAVAAKDGGDTLADLIEVARYLFTHLPMADTAEAKAGARAGARYMEIISELSSYPYFESPADRRN